MKILDFYKNYPDEQSCKSAFIERRISEGIICKRCRNTKHYWKTGVQQWQCKSCGFRTTIKSGTVMENSKMPFQSWFIAMHLLTSTKKSFSAKEIQRQIGHNRYEPIWAMLHKIRSVMGLRDDEYTLENEVELDEGFFETISKGRDKNEPLKRGRGSQRQTMVLVMAESKEVSDPKLNKKHGCTKKLGFLKMKVLEGGYKAELFDQKIEGVIVENSCITTDDSTSYVNFNKSYKHKSQKIPKNQVNAILPWVHTSISNAKKLLLDIYHGIDEDFLGNYLNEYVYKLNRRYFNDLFSRLLSISTQYRWNDLG